MNKNRLKLFQVTSVFREKLANFDSEGDVIDDVVM